MKVDINISNFLEGIKVGIVSPSLKKTFIPKVTNARDFGGKLRLTSVDLEAWCPTSGDMNFKSDAFLIVGGVQNFDFHNKKLRVGVPHQYVVDGRTVLDVAYNVYKFCEHSDAIFGHYSKWDADILKNYSYLPLMGRKYGIVPPLPDAMIDIMGPTKSMGISSSQEHLCDHYELGVHKTRVNLEKWQHVLLGEKLGMSKKAIHEDLRFIRDERNKNCLLANHAQVGFLSQHITYMNKMITKEIYPNKDKILNEKPVGRSV